MSLQARREQARLARMREESGVVSELSGVKPHEQELLEFSQKLSADAAKKREEEEAARLAKDEADAYARTVQQLKEKAEASAAAMAKTRALMASQRAMADKARLEQMKQREARNQLVVMPPQSSRARQFVAEALSGWYEEVAAARERESRAGAGTGAPGDDDAGDDVLPPMDELFDFIIRALDRYDEETKDPLVEAQRFSEFFMGSLFDDAFDPPSDVIGASISNGTLCSMFRFALEKAGVHASLFPMPTLTVDLDARRVSGAVIKLVSRGGEGMDRSFASDNQMFVCLPTGATGDCLSPGGQGAGILDRVPSFNYLLKLHQKDADSVLPNLGDVSVLPQAVKAALEAIGAPDGTFDNYAVQIFSSRDQPYLFVASPPSGDAGARAAMRTSLSQACERSSRRVTRVWGQTSTAVTIADNKALRAATQVSTLPLHLLPATSQYKEATRMATTHMKDLADAVAAAVGCFVKWAVPSEIIMSSGNTFNVPDDTAGSGVSFLSACAPVPRVVGVSSSDANRRHVMFVAHNKPLLLFTGNDASTRATIPDAYEAPLALPMYSGSSVMCLEDMEAAEAEKAARGAFAPTTCVRKMRKGLEMESAVFTHPSPLTDATIKSFANPIHGAATMDNGSMMPKGALVVL